MKTCIDFDSKHCCMSCHEDWEEGWGLPIEIYDKNDNLYAEVCCSQIDFAQKEADDLKSILRDLRYDCNKKLEYHKNRKSIPGDYGSGQQEINNNINIYTNYLLALDAAIDWIPDNAELHHRKWWPGFQQGKIIE